MACEVISLAILMALVGAASYTDVKFGIIPNRMLMCAMGTGIVVNLVYSFVTSGAYLTEYLSNVALLSVFALLLYALRLWAAGDSKLLIAVAFCLPGRFLTFWDIGMFASFSIVAIAFITAFIFVLGESVVLGIRNQDLFKSLPAFDFPRYACSYLFTVAATTVFFVLFQRIVPRVFAEHGFMLMAVDLVVVLVLMQLRNRFQLRTLWVAAAVMWVAVLALIFSGNVVVLPHLNLFAWALTLLVSFACVLAGKYGYQEVPTSTVQAGMILSAGTVLSFRLSRVKGLPSGLSEDLTCRLSGDEAASVRRWERSAHGKPCVTIVRKLPFALFIGIGTVALVAIEVIMIWR